MNFFSINPGMCKKEWRTFQRKLLLLLFIKLFPIIITYSENMVNSLLFICYYIFLFFIGHLLCAKNQSNKSGKAYIVLVPMEFTF